MTEETNVRHLVLGDNLDNLSQRTAHLVLHKELFLVSP
jgi:hypothetical protein